MPFTDFAPLPTQDAPPPKGGGFEAFGPLPGGVRKPSPASPRTPPPEPDDPIKAFGKTTLSEAASLGDLVLSIPSQLIGVGAGLGMGARKLGEGGSRREVSQAALDASGAVNTALGSPLHKIMGVAGLGAKEGKPGSTVDSIMEKASDFLKKGGEWVEKNTGGLLLKEDVENVVNTAMAAAGGRGLAAGLEKITPAQLRLEGVRLSPESLRRIEAGELQKAEPVEAVAAMGAKTEEAATAAKGKQHLTEGKILNLNPITGELTEPPPPMGKPLPKPSTKERALEKMAGGKSWDMTAEERIAYKGWKDEPPPTLVDSQGAPLTMSGKSMRVPKGQLGAIDMGAFKRGQADGKGLSYEEFSKLADTLSLGSLLARSDYTLKTLDRLPQGATELSKAHIEQELRRADVTDAERAAINAALAETPGRKISAKDLVLGVKKATGDFELGVKETDKYADYGIEAIRDYDPNETPAPGEAAPRTTLYRSPFEVDPTASNHFNDKQLFGWTRSFDEGGVRHVVEIQSDLAQHAKGLTEDDKADLRDEISRAQAHVAEKKMMLDEAEQLYNKANEGPPTQELLDLRGIRNEIRNEHRSATLHVAELQAKLEGGQSAERISPMLKNWPKRLVREELAGAAQKGEKTVRFATADTVAKVEKWPLEGVLPEDIRNWEQKVARAEQAVENDKLDGHTGLGAEANIVDLRAAQRNLALARELAKEPPRRSPEHQSIYDRYKKDIEKFLRQQGGKDITDSSGHTWIEVPVPKKGPTQMFGGADPNLLARLALVGLGGWAAAHFSDDDKLTHAIFGGIGGAILARSHPIEMAKAVKFALSPQGPRFSIADLAQGREDLVRTTGIDAALAQKKLEKGTSLKEREQITEALDKGEIDKLPPKLQELARFAQGVFDAKLWQGIDTGVLESAVDNYVPHIVDMSGDAPKRLGDFMRSFGQSTSPSTVHAIERKMPTISELEKAGFKLKTKDISTLLGMYSNSLTNAIANKGLLEELKRGELPRFSDVGPAKPITLLMKEKEAPKEYVHIEHPQMRGYKAHPDIEGQLKLLFDTHPAGDWMKAAGAVSDVTKRLRVSFSLFHAKSLTEAAVRASSHPLKALAMVPGALRGTNQWLQEINKGSASSLVRDSIHDGLMYSVKGHGSEDAGVGFYGAMNAAQKFADSVIPGAGLPIAGLKAINRGVDTLMWERLHPALKMMLWSEKKAQLIANGVPKEEAGKIAASYANDVEGGLNYTKIAMEARTRFGRQLAENAFSPAGRRGLQLAFFAPDWNIAAVRTVVNAFGPGTGVKGFMSPKTLADLHRQLILRSGLYYFIGFNALNLAMSGHNIWQNKDWTKIDMDAKGTRHLQIDKGMMEVPNMIRQPRQEFLNKLGYVPSELANQALGTEYLNPREDKRTGAMVAGPPMRSSPPAHAIGQLLPFALQDRPTMGPTEEALTALGLVQITGSTPASRAKQKAENAARRKKEKKK